MGLTYVTTAISSIDGTGAPFETEFLVDTGAVDCMIPSDELTKAGVHPTTRRTYELADGTIVDYPVGFAYVRFMGDEVITQVIFGPPECEPILGVVALELTGIMVDPRTNALKRVHAISLK